MKLKLLGVALFVLMAIVLTITCTSPPLPSHESIKKADYSTEKTWMEGSDTDAGLIHEEIDDEPSKATAKDAGTTISLREQKVNDVIEVWNMFLDDAGARQSDPRRSMFPTYAENVVESITMYQMPHNDTGTVLPKDDITHILVATMITLESSVMPDVIGRSNSEVGLLQVHGRALGGYSPRVVQNNSYLGVFLGVRWLTSMLNECPETQEKLKSGTWKEEDWIKPLSVYAGGPNAKSTKTKRCKKFKVARERLDQARMYLTRIKANARKQ